MIFVQIKTFGWYQVGIAPTKASVQLPCSIVISKDMYLDITTWKRQGDTNNFVATVFQECHEKGSKTKSELFLHIKAIRVHAYMAIPKPMHCPPMFKEA